MFKRLSSMHESLQKLTPETASDFLPASQCRSISYHSPLSYADRAFCSLVTSSERGYLCQVESPVAILYAAWCAKRNYGEWLDIIGHVSAICQPKHYSAESTVMAFQESLQTPNIRMQRADIGMRRAPISQAFSFGRHVQQTRIFGDKQQNWVMRALSLLQTILHKDDEDVASFFLYYQWGVICFIGSKIMCE